VRKIQDEKADVKLMVAKWPKKPKH